jgi:hypothetical protein
VAVVEVEERKVEEEAAVVGTEIIGVSAATTRRL